MSRELGYRTSLLVNLVLVTVVLVLIRHKSAPASVVSVPEVSSDKKTVEVPIGDQLKLREQVNKASASGRQSWVQQLRAAGVSEKVLARAVLSDFEEEWDGRVEECHGDAQKIAALQCEKERDEDAEMRAALGGEGFRRWDEGHMLGEVDIGKIPLTASETNAIYDLKKKLQQRRWELDEARLNGEMDDAEINDASDQAYSEFNQQMKALLGDGRYAAAQGLDDGAAATNLRQDLAKANPNDAQFQDLLKAQQELDERHLEIDKQFQDNPSSPDYAAQLKALDEARDQEFQRVLGTNVFDSLQKEQDVGCSKMKKYENIWGLDDGKVDYVYGAIKYYDKSVQDYQAQAQALASQGQSVDWDAVNKNLQQFAQQTQQSLQSYLGQDSFDKMQRNGIFQFNQLPRQGQNQ